jgi:hypothetical protein
VIEYVMSLAHTLVRTFRSVLGSSPARKQCASKCANNFCKEPAMGPPFLSVIASRMRWHSPEISPIFKADKITLHVSPAPAGRPHCQPTKEEPMQTERKYWFPAKRYGWGWGVPSSWQGWLVLAAFVGLLVVGSFLFPPSAKLGAYLAYLPGSCRRVAP